MKKLFPFLIIIVMLSPNMINSAQLDLPVGFERTMEFQLELTQLLIEGDGVFNMPFIKSDRVHDVPKLNDVKIGYRLNLSHNGFGVGVLDRDDSSKWLIYSGSLPNWTCCIMLVSQLDLYIYFFISESTFTNLFEVDSAFPFVPSVATFLDWEFYEDNLGLRFADTLGSNNYSGGINIQNNVNTFDYGYSVTYPGNLTSNLVSFQGNFSQLQDFSYDKITGLLITWTYSVSNPDIGFKLEMSWKSIVPAKVTSDSSVSSNPSTSQDETTTESDSSTSGTPSVSPESSETTETTFPKASIIFFAALIIRVKRKINTNRPIINCR